MSEVFGHFHIYMQVGNMTNDEAKEKLERMVKEFGEQHGLDVHTQDLYIQE